MASFLMLAAIVIVFCVFLDKLSDKMGLPTLLAFILLGVVFGSDGIFKIEFENYAFAEHICSVALIFIMFYGGFGTNWKQARTVALSAGVLSTLGVVATAGLTGLFCHYVLGFEMIHGMLIGSVISSTDAASVFSILRSKRLNLKYNTASLLEVESGSNDPTAYMLTIVCLAILRGGADGSDFLLQILRQVGFGLVFGFGIAYAAGAILKNIRFQAEGFDMVFVTAVALLSYAAPSMLDGNGYLSAYITGIILGNTNFKDKKNIFLFFDGMTGLMQMSVFFLLGLLALPSKLPEIATPALYIALFMTFVARPLSVFVLLAPLKGGCAAQKLLVSFAGLRGASAIVFSIIAVMNSSSGDAIFHVTFFIVLLSILFQGALLPVVAKKLDMIDNNEDVMKSFSDYTEEDPVQFIQFEIPENHLWIGKTLREIELPPTTLVVLLKRRGEKIVPNGDTVLFAEDVLILGALTPGEVDGVALSEIYVTPKSLYLNKKISEISLGDGALIILIKRGDKVIIPQGNDELILDDILVINQIAGDIEAVHE